MLMKKVLYFLLFIANLFLIFILLDESISYSFFQKLFFNTAKSLNNSISSDGFYYSDEIDLEDNIYIPPIKDFKKIFLKDINENSYIVVTIPENVLRFYVYNSSTGIYEVKRMYPVSVGRPSRQTEIGEGIIYTKGHIYFKHHYGTNQGKLITVGHDKNGKEFRIPYEKMYGLYMIINRTDKFVIHSTTEYWRIKQPVSSGCVRMLIDDMLDLYPLVHPVIRVYIRYQLFKLDGNLLTVYPDIYNKYTDIKIALLEYLKKNGFDPIIFDKEKIKKFLFNNLPNTIDINLLLNSFFIEHKIAIEKLKNIKFNVEIEDNNTLPDEKLESILNGYKINY